MRDRPKMLRGSGPLRITSLRVPVVTMAHSTPPPPSKEKIELKFPRSLSHRTLTVVTLLKRPLKSLRRNPLHVLKVPLSLSLSLSLSIYIYMFCLVMSIHTCKFLRPPSLFFWMAGAEVVELLNAADGDLPVMRVEED